MGISLFGEGNDERDVLFFVVNFLGVNFMFRVGKGE